MAKFAGFAALFVAFIFLVSASTQTTMITSTTTDDENQMGQMCQREARQMRMHRCMQYMRMGTPYAATNRRFGDEQMREQCCNDLRRVSPLCRCKALRHMVRRMQDEYGMQEEMHQMRQTAQMLPEMCGMTMPRPCHFGRALDF